jgi:hypothetical protein
MRKCSLSLFVIVLVMGCGGNTRSSPVSGSVTMDGEPLANAMVSFQPIGKELNSGPGSTGKTNNKGEYALEVVGGGNGAVEGLHKVMIRSGVAKVTVPAKYNVKTELRFEVKPGNNANVDFKLTSK